MDQTDQETVQQTERIERIAGGEGRLEDLVAALAPAQEHLDALLFAAADEVRRSRVGDGVHLRALIEISNHCARTCRYCGLRAGNRHLPRYRMEPEEIVAVAMEAAALGYRTVVMQSGEDSWYEAEAIAAIVRQIKAEADVAITLCVGERPREDYVAWREAGADRYLLRIETSDRDLYRQLHPRMSFDNRLRCLHLLRELGYQVGTGVLIGLPGQSAEHLARDVQFFAKFQPNMIGMGPFIPNPNTPLAGCSGGDVASTLRMIALSRLLVPDAHIVATTALGSIDPLGREKGLQAGADVMMPNMTPGQYRSLYEIYPNKICIAETGSKCRGCTDLRLRAIGRHVAQDRGDALVAPDASAR